MISGTNTIHIIPLMISISYQILNDVNLLLTDIRIDNILYNIKFSKKIIYIFKLHSLLKFDITYVYMNIFRFDLL
jgi:hypothetical protein